MKKRAYAELAGLEKTFWWHVGRMDIIDKQLRPLSKGKKSLSILNIGAGTGGTIPTLEKHGTVVNVDTSDEAISFLNSSGYEVKKIDGKKLPFKDDSFDVLAALDVLEHVEDDSRAVKEWARVLRPGGHIILTVPAYQWLWSEHDETNMHFRRYTKSSLQEVLSEAGSLSSRKTSYMIAFSLPLIIGFRLLEKVRPRKLDKKSTNFIPLPQKINSLFIEFLKAEGSLQKIIDLPAGTSLIAVYQKKSPKSKTTR